MTRRSLLWFMCASSLDGGCAIAGIRRPGAYAKPQDRIWRLGAGYMEFAQNGLKRVRSRQERPWRDIFKAFRQFRLTGAGEGIRTLDPNLGKVVLYP